MSVIYLCKIGELMLKGLNRRDFEGCLVENVRQLLRPTSSRFRLTSGRLYVENDDDGASPAIEDALDHLIGITSWARARQCEKHIEAIAEAVYEEALLAKKRGAVSFKVETRRADKGFPLNSYQISARTGARVAEGGLLAVDVHRPDVEINVEVRDRCFVYGNERRACRGLPVGTAPRGLLLLSGGIDSPVAGYRMMRRGMRVDCVYFDAPPYTSAEARQKVVDLAAVLRKFGLDSTLTILPFTEVELRLRERSPRAFLTVLLRVCMMKGANLTAERGGARCLITGESLGQVASQTLENMSITEHYAALPLLRPLVGLDKEEIIETARQIKTYDISILPFEDCCVLFSPEHPVLRAKLEEVKTLVSALDIDPLIAQAFEQRIMFKE